MRLLGLQIPLNPDPYTSLSASGGPPVFHTFQGRLDASGGATASLVLPALATASFTLHHAFVVFDTTGLHMASNAVPLRVD